MKIKKSIKGCDCSFVTWTFVHQFFSVSRTAAELVYIQHTPIHGIISEPFLDTA